ncbi:YktB family protein [Virgibacillus xinjiangensis]|uniref:UPF0637 protein ACFOGI_08020 n=1 Tax=Virgibacillus xinjiangensis TaxID=393090 RepID=A0ABV7CV72_9BACI
MTFKGFTEEDFNTFTIDGLDERMEAIQTRIQPKFEEIGNHFANFLSAKLENEMFLHIAKHARRTVNPPEDTWLALADNKRGYKKHPHFQVGLFDDHVFIWLALIYELDFKKEIAETYVENFQELKSIPGDYMVSLDHTKRDAIQLDKLQLKDVERFRDVKKAEFLIGQHLPIGDPRLSDGKKFLETVEETFETLIPFYKQALQARN